MATNVATRTPTHLWVVGVLALLWNAFGAYDYTMTRMRDAEYLKGMMPGADPEAVLGWIDSMPLYAQVGWGLGVWGALLGAVLLLMRSKWAVHAYVVSTIGMVLSLGHQMFLAPPMPGAEAVGVMVDVMPWVIIVAGLLQLWYAWTQRASGVLR
jgi:hypothetical protein